MDVEESILSRQVKPEVERIKQRILDKKEECDKDYRIIVKSMAGVPEVPNSFKDFCTSVVSLYIELAPHIPIEKEIYAKLVDLNKHARNPKSLHSMYKNPDKVFYDFVDYYFLMIGFLHDIGFTKIDNLKSNSFELLGEF